MNADERRSREIMSQIRAVLVRDWDPLNLRSLGFPEDEYDCCIGDVYRLLAQGVDEQALVSYLLNQEESHFGSVVQGSQRAQNAAHQLMKIDVRLREGTRNFQ